MPSRTPLSVALMAASMLLATVRPGCAGSPNEQDFQRIQKGRYLAHAADCMSCHTVRDGGKIYAGGRPIETPFGDIVSSNITPDQETGIGAWTDDQFDDAVRKGLRPDGSRLYPAMPFTAYTKMSRDDVMAIRTYLATIPPVRNKVVSNTLPFPFNIRFSMVVWDALYFTEGEFKADPKKSTEWNRGAFLVQGPAHCGACHTPKSFLGGDKTDEFLQGANIQGWWAPDVTGDNDRGLGHWSKEDIVAYLKTGHNRISAATGPMAEEVELSSSQMNDSDVQAIATYLKSLSGKSENVTAVAANDPAMVAGKAIYRDQCSACHALDGHGVPNLFPSIADSSMVRSDDPTTLIRIVLRGARSAATKAEPTSPGMPAFGWQLNDTQVAAVLTYVRNTWGHAAKAVSEGDVSGARSDLKTRKE